MPRSAVDVSLAAVMLAALLAGGSGGGAHARGSDASVRSVPHAEWSWPVAPFRLVEPYVQPAHRYGAGHRGIDLEPLEATEVRTPAAGIIAFAGMVADRAIVTIDHGDGLVTTLEPVVSALEPGELVERGDIVGGLSAGGHAAPGTLHFGVRLGGEYLNPLALLGGIPRAVLLPCCD